MNQILSVFLKTTNNRHTAGISFRRFEKNDGPFNLISYSVSVKGSASPPNVFLLRRVTIIILCIEAGLDLILWRSSVMTNDSSSNSSVSRKNPSVITDCNQ